MRKGAMGKGADLFFLLFLLRVDVTLGPRCANYRMARALAPITGRIYECNRTDDRVGKSFAHCLWGESIYALLGAHNW